MRIVASSVPSPRAPFADSSLPRTQFGTMAQLDRRWQATTMEKRGGGRGSNPFGAHRVGIPSAARMAGDDVVGVVPTRNSRKLAASWFLDLLSLSSSRSPQLSEDAFLRSRPQRFSGG